MPAMPSMPTIPGLNRGGAAGAAAAGGEGGEAADLTTEQSTTGLASTENVKDDDASRWVEGYVTTILRPNDGDDGEQLRRTTA